MNITPTHARRNRQARARSGSPCATKTRRHAAHATTGQKRLQGIERVGNWMKLRHTHATLLLGANVHPKVVSERLGHATEERDRKSTRLNSSHQIISYAVFCLKKKKTYYRIRR